MPKRALETGWEYFTEQSIISGTKDHCLIIMQHMIIWVGGAVVHGERWYGKATGWGGGGDHNLRYAVRGGWKACPVVPGRGGANTI